MRLIDIEIGILKEDEQEQEKLFEEVGIKVKRKPATTRTLCTIDLDKVNYVWDDLEDDSIKINFIGNDVDICVYNMSRIAFKLLWLTHNITQKESHA